MHITIFTGFLSDWVKKVGEIYNYVAIRIDDDILTICCKWIHYNASKMSYSTVSTVIYMSIRD